MENEIKINNNSSAENLQVLKNDDIKCLIEFLKSLKISNEKNSRFSSKNKDSKIFNIDSLININNKLVFFWKSNDDPWDMNQRASWSQYGLKEQSIIEQNYREFIQSEFENKIKVEINPNYYIDFSNMLQVNKFNINRIRPMQRCHPKLISNKFRNIPYDYFPEKSISQNNIEIYKIYFNIFQESKIEIDIYKQYSPFENNFTIDISLSEMKDNKLLFIELLVLIKLFTFELTLELTLK